MADVQTYTFEYKEITEALVKKLGIHEGLWGIYLEFGIGGGNIPGPSEHMVLPAAIVPILKIGIHRYSKPSSLTVDAAEVNPADPVDPKPIRGAQKPPSRRQK